MTENNQFKRYDRKLYEELEKKPDSELTEEERQYCIFCYHWEEGLAGLL